MPRQRRALMAENFEAIRESIDRVLDQVVEDARLAVVLGRINVLPRTEPRVYKRFNKTHAGRLFVLMRTETLHFQLLALSRLWDEGRQALSIPRAVGLLGQPEVLADIVARRRSA